MGLQRVGHNCSDLAHTQKIITHRINKQWWIQTMEYYLALKRNELTNHEKAWKNFLSMHVNKGKKPISKGYIWDDSNSMTFWKRQNYGNNRKSSS